MTDYIVSMEYMVLNTERKKKDKVKATITEFTEFKSLTGEILWLGGGVNPQSPFLE